MREESLSNNRSAHERRHRWRVLCLLFAMGALLAITTAATTGAEAGTRGGAAPVYTVQFGKLNLFMNGMFGALTGSKLNDTRVQITNLSEQLYVVDLPSMGVRPLQGTRPLLKEGADPDTGAVGLLGAYMSVSPDVVSQSIPSGFGAASANWMPGEQVAVSLNGGPPTNYAASSTGRLGQIFNVGAGEGYITIEARGLSSGRQTGGVVEVRDSAPPVPGLAVAPHAINPNGSSHINVLGTRYQANYNVTLARNGTTIATLPSGATGSLYYQINVAASIDTSAVYNTYTNTVGSRAGQSIEERADAGVPPIGDQNVVRAMIDRPILPTTGGTVGLVATGFAPGETVTVTVCGNLSGAADANGTVRFFLGLNGSGSAQCSFYGSTTGRIARSSVLLTSDTINAPGIIAAPEAVAGTGTFTLMMDRLLPSQSGTVYIDGVAQGGLSTDSSGKAAALINKPTSGFLHAVRWVGSTGQSVSAPLLYLPAGGTPTPTRTATRTPTNTPTNIPSNTPTDTPTNTALPTQTPGGFTATPVPTNTNTPVPTSTNTPIATDTPVGGSPTPTACLIEFTDVPSGSTFYPFVKCLACRSIVGGYSASPPCTTGVPCFLPGNNVTRGQMAKFVSNAAGYTDVIPPSQQTFTDVPPGSTFWEVVERVYLHGVVGGYSASPPCTTGVPCFLPGNSVTRGQIAKFVSNAAGYADPIPPSQQTFTDVPTGSTFWEVVERVYLHGVVTGYNTSPPCFSGVPCFLPGNNVTRGQTAKFISNTFFPDCDTP